MPAWTWRRPPRPSRPGPCAWCRCRRRATATRPSACRSTSSSAPPSSARSSPCAAASSCASPRTTTTAPRTTRVWRTPCATRFAATCSPPDLLAARRPARHLSGARGQTPSRPGERPSKPFIRSPSPRRRCAARARGPRALVPSGRPADGLSGRPAGQWLSASGCRPVAPTMAPPPPPPPRRPIAAEIACVRRRPADRPR
mmetsp:Transcript_8160/g.25927  ORF Transcript_8160/g.25927 Transcript_8160/m.25927 type:complete len:200 (+) Transcript_8160:956-1555(+)